MEFIYPRATETVTESQNVWGQKAPLEVTRSTIPAQAAPQRPGGPGMHPDSFYGHKEWDSTTSLGNLSQSFVTLPAEMCFLVFSPPFPFVLIASCPVTTNKPFS